MTLLFRRGDRIRLKRLDEVLGEKYRPFNGLVVQIADIDRVQYGSALCYRVDDCPVGFPSNGGFYVDDAYCDDPWPIDHPVAWTSEPDKGLHYGKIVKCREERGAGGHRLFEVLEDDNGDYWSIPDNILEDVGIKESLAPPTCRHHDEWTGVTFPAQHLLYPEPQDYMVKQQEEGITEGLRQQIESAVKRNVREWPICSLTSNNTFLTLTLQPNRISRTISPIWSCPHCSESLTQDPPL